MTRDVVLYDADRSRGQQVAERRLEGFTGRLHSDFYGAYWALGRVAYAPCWAHLCRNARQVAESQSEPAQAADFHEWLSGLYGRGAAARGRPATAERSARAMWGNPKAQAKDVTLGANADVAHPAVVPPPPGRTGGLQPGPDAGGGQQPGRAGTAAPRDRATARAARGPTMGRGAAQAGEAHRG